MTAFGGSASFGGERVVFKALFVERPKLMKFGSESFNLNFASYLGVPSEDSYSICYYLMLLY